MRRMSIAAASVCLVSAAALIATPALAASHHHNHHDHHSQHAKTKAVSGSYTFYNQDVAGDNYVVKAQQSFSVKVHAANVADSIKNYDSKVTVKTTDKLDVTVTAGKHEVSVQKCKLVSGKKCTRVVVNLKGKAVTQYGTVYHESGQLITEVSQDGHTATWGSLGAITKDA